MDARTIVAAPGIYKPEAKLNQVPTIKKALQAQSAGGSGGNADRWPEGRLYNPPFIELIQTNLLNPCVSALTRRKLCAEC